MTRRRYLRKKSLEEARRAFLEKFRHKERPRPEEMPAAQALGRIAALPVEALVCSPSYHAASMDGYAVEARSTFTARENAPVDLEIGVGAHEVDTGDPLPGGTDAVIMVEDVHYPEERLIRIYRSLSPYENVRLMGEDIVAGEMILPAGKRITPFDIGLCLAAGLTKVAVRPKPRVAIIPTGDELVPPGTPPETGKIIEFNSSILAGMVQEKGGEAVVWPITPDSRDRIREAVTSALEEADVAVVSAGSSAGRDDHTAGVIEGLGELLVHGVSIVPGKPTALGIIGGRPVIGLPGYPASAIISFRQFVLPLIDQMLGEEEAESTFTALLSRDMPSRPGHTEFPRGQVGRVRERAVFIPLPRGASLISSFARANALAEIPAEVEGVERGEAVRVSLLASQAEMERSLLLAGSHDLCLDILRDELLALPGHTNLLVSTQGSLGGLLLLADDYAHLATCHLLDPETGLYNRPYIDRFLPGRKVILLHVAGREQGLMVKKGNHRGIHGLADLVREDLTFVNRQRGSGTRILLDHLLGKEEIDPSGIRGYQREEVNHLTVAAAVSSGLADAGLGILPAASALGLDFIPLAREMFDLVLPEENFGSEAVARVTEVVSSRSFQRRLENLGGYDTSVSGKLD